MTALTHTTQVHRDERGLHAQCSSCHEALRQVDGFDPDIALGTLFQHHPTSAQAVHRLTRPAGWEPDSP